MTSATIQTTHLSWQKLNIKRPAKTNVQEIEPEPLPSAINNHSLNLFQELPEEYDPSVHWLDGQTPNHPLFTNASKIQDLIRVIKDQLLEYILEGCRELLQRQGVSDLLSTFEHDKYLWQGAVSMHKYGVVYLGSRADCRQTYLPALQSNQARFRTIEIFLLAQDGATRAINYGVHRWVNASNIKVEFPGKLVPPRAISSIALHHIAIRAVDFEAPSLAMLNETQPLWDLHDFAHHTVASLSPTLYGSKYFSHLIHLPARSSALIRSPGMKTADPKPRCSDGVVFSEFLTELFHSELAAMKTEQRTRTYADMTDHLATQVAQYLLGERPLLHPTSGIMMSMKEPITAERLAVLAQNKAYELTASEIEQRVMTRGGPVGDERDELDKLTLEDRIKILASNRTWMFFEVRNTIKHRAHKLAYQKVARHMRGASGKECSQRDSAMLDLLIQGMEYQGWEQGKVANLWQVLIDRDRK